MKKYNLPWNQRYRIDQKTGCFNWIMSTSHGYAQTKINRKTVRAHRVAYEKVNGPIPEGVVIRHTCDNPICVNPDHLIPGGQLDNIGDMDKRRRDNRGRKSAPRLTPDQVRDIRFRLETLEETLISVARNFKMSRMQIRRIRDWIAWAHID